VQMHIPPAAIPENAFLLAALPVLSEINNDSNRCSVFGDSIV
jgi:hypothetical protein